jgi:UDP-2-acetamido-2,6-beta-L-arabino-hexul-4-ose reductase
MKIAITGAYGFLGSYTTDLLLKDGHEINCFDRQKHSLESASSLSGFLKNAEIVIHLAGSNRADPETLLRVNTLGTQVLLSAIETYCPRARLIFASSFQVYARHSVYALSKLFAEELIGYAARENNLFSIILRFANLYGPGGKPNYNSVIATFADRIKRNLPLEINNDGSQKRDYLFVTDAAEAIKKAINYKQEDVCEIFDICSGTNISLNKVIATFRKHCSHDINITYRQNVRQSEWSIPKRSYREAEEKLHWVPRVSFDEGIRRMIYD